MEKIAERGDLQLSATLKFLPLLRHKGGVDTIISSSANVAQVDNILVSIKIRAHKYLGSVCSDHSYDVVGFLSICL